MSWMIVERKIGRAGGLKERTKRQNEWDEKYGNWEVGYVIDGEFIDQNKALEIVYYSSYEKHFENHPDDISELITLAKKLNNPHAKATTGVDLQVPAIMNYLKRNNLKLLGNQLVDIGSWNGEYSHPISKRLSPLQIKCVLDEKLTLEKWWQTKKCLAKWIEDDYE